MSTVYVHKAQPIGDGVVQDKTIILSASIPHCEMAEADSIMELDADKLHQALYYTLPGGTYDRLLCLMLKKKSSHFIVPHAEEP